MSNKIWSIFLFVTDNNLSILGVPGEPVEITSEEDIFVCINYPYKNPEDRNA